MGPDALDLVPLDDLKRAILRRCELVIIATCTPGDGTAQLSWARQGDGHRLIGLAEEFKFVMLAELAVKPS